MSENDWFVMRPQKAQAYGRPETGGFLVRKGSTAMREGSPRVKRDREEWDQLSQLAVLVPGQDKETFRFVRNHLFHSAIIAAARSKTAIAVGSGRFPGKHSKMLTCDAKHGSG